MVGEKIFHALKDVTHVKNIFRRLSLRTQLLLIILFILLISVSSLSIISARSEEAIIEKVTGDLDDITKAIQISVEEMTYRGDSTQRLKSYVGMLNRKGIKEISIISDDAQVIASSNPKKIGTMENPKKIAGQEIATPTRVTTRACEISPARSDALGAPSDSPSLRNAPIMPDTVPTKPSNGPSVPMMPR